MNLERDRAIHQPHRRATPSHPFGGGEDEERGRADDRDLGATELPEESVGEGNQEDHGPRRRAQSVLSIVVVAVSAAALTIALTIGSIADRPYDRTFEATNGAHLVVSSFPGGPALDGIGELPGVVGSTGVRGVVFSAFDLDSRRYGLRLVESRATRDEEKIAKPAILVGTWPRDGEMLVERSFAAFHHVVPGSKIRTRRATLVVSGIAAVAAGQAYPRSQPGVGFATRATLLRVDPDPTKWGHMVGVRIANPGAASVTAELARQDIGAPVGIETWTEARSSATETLASVVVVLSLFGMLLLLAAGAVLATLVGGRVVAQTREIGVLKATGLTPRQVAQLLLTEQLALAVVGLVLGIGTGYLLTPIFVSASASLLNAPESPTVDPGHSLLVVAVVLFLVALFAGIPGLRAARRSTAETIAGRSTGRRSSRLGAMIESVGAPVSVSVGVRGSFGHRGRVLLTALSLALTVAAAVATLGMEASLGVVTDPGVSPLVQGREAPLFERVDDDAGEAERLRPIVYSLDAVLLFIGLVNLAATLLLTTRERVRDLGMLKAVGLTPRQVTGSLVSEQVAVAVVAGVVGVPLGLLLFRAGIELAGSADEFAYPSWWALALLIPGVVALVALIAAPLARRAASLPVADALRFE